MRNLNTILVLFTGILCFYACEAKCRGKTATKLKRSFKLAVSSDKINNRHKAGLRKIFRKRRDVKDEEVKESDKFTAEIKFLQKWNPAMSKKDGSAYRLFQGNVLDAVLEQLNADQRFINSKVLDLKQTSDGILAQVGFHFRKSEHNPISHVRFVVSRGHLSSLKVDKHYFKLLKTPAKFANDHDNKISTSHQQSTNTQTTVQTNSNAPKQEPQQSPPVQKQQNEAPSKSASSQTQSQPNTNADHTLTQANAQYPSQPQNEAKPQGQPSSQVSAQSQAPAQNQATKGQNQDQTQSTNANAQPGQSKSQDQSQKAVQAAKAEQTQPVSQDQSQKAVQATKAEQTQPVSQDQSQNVVQAAKAEQTQPVSQDQSQNAVQAKTAEQTQPVSQDQSQNVVQAAKAEQTQPVSQDQSQNAVQAAKAEQTQPVSQDQSQNAVQAAKAEQTQPVSQDQNQNVAQGPDYGQVAENNYASNQPAQAQYQAAASEPQQTNPQLQSAAAYQPAEQLNAQVSQYQNTPNPSTDVNGARTQNNDKTNKNQANSADNTPPKVSNDQQNQDKKESSQLTTGDNQENVSIKMNQGWYAFLSNHDSPQYKMLAGNLEKGLKSVMSDDKNTKDIKVKNLLQADEGHTMVEFVLQFNGGKEGSTEKLRNIVKTGDIAGISVDSSYFKIN